MTSENNTDNPHSIGLTRVHNKDREQIWKGDKGVILDAMTKAFDYLEEPPVDGEMPDEVSMLTFPDLILDMIEEVVVKHAIAAGQNLVRDAERQIVDVDPHSVEFSVGSIKVGARCVRRKGTVVLLWSQEIPKLDHLMLIHKMTILKDDTDVELPFSTKLLEEVLSGDRIFLHVSCKEETRKLLLSIED